MSNTDDVETTSTETTETETQETETTGENDKPINIIEEVDGVVSNFAAHSSPDLVKDAEIKEGPPAATAVGTTEDKKREDKWKEGQRKDVLSVLARHGIQATPELVNDMVVERQVKKASQRKLPMGEVVTSAALIAFFSNREDPSDRGIIFDMAKGIRRDGGVAGPVGLIEQILKRNLPPGTPATAINAAAKAIDAKQGERIDSIRKAVISTMNELRRRQLVAAGEDATADEHYLQIRRA